MSVKLINHVVQQYVHGVRQDKALLKRVIVDRSHKLIYNRIRKNANTFVANFIYGQSELSDYEGDWANVNANEAKRRSANLSNSLVMESLKNYRSLLIIRNPEHRTLSAFLQKFSTDRYQSDYGPFELNQAGFEKFVQWLTEGNLTLDRHWDCQSREITFPMDFYTDIVPFEELNTHLPVIFKELGYDTSVMTDDNFLTTSTRHKTRSAERSKEFVNAETRRRIAQLYANDYENFGKFY